MRGAIGEPCVSSCSWRPPRGLGSSRGRPGKSAASAYNAGMAAGTASTGTATSAAYSAGVAAGTTSGYAAGVTVGTAAGVTAAIATPGAPASVGAGYMMGGIYPTLPAGCVSPIVQGTTYDLCGNTWFKPVFGANGVLLPRGPDAVKGEGQRYGPVQSRRRRSPAALGEGLINKFC